MKDYLSKYYDWKTDEIAFSYDDLPMWSSVPGNLLLEGIEYGTNKTVLDIGFGTGFPLIQLAHRFGASCKIIGIELWTNAIDKARQKIRVRGIRNITILNEDAASTSLDSASVDIITSNLGINNFEHPEIVIRECWRILKPGGLLYLSSNLIGTFAEFYDIFEETAIQLGASEVIERLHTHINHRQSEDSLKTMFDSNKFKIIDSWNRVYKMKYADGTAFLNDYFTVMCFLPSWKDMIDIEAAEVFFTELENNLNKAAVDRGGLSLTTPIVVKKVKKI